MINYLIRRLFQMSVVVFLSTLAIYVILNIAPGGPLSGINLGATRDRISATEIARIEAYLGIDKPLALRYIAWLVGDDWLGADWMHMGITPLKQTKIGQNGTPVFQVDKNTGEKVPVFESFRYWSDPGVAQIEASYQVWVWGEEIESGVIEAVKIQVSPDFNASRPENLTVFGEVQNVDGGTLTVRDLNFNIFRVESSPETSFQFEEGVVPPRPTEGNWVNISNLFGAYGLLGKYANFHGDSRGLLRGDFGTSWRTNQPVMSLIQSRLSNTLILMSLATTFSLLVAIPIGIYSAINQYSKVDYAVTTFAFFGSAMPVFWFGLMMILVFSLFFKDWGMPFLPSGGTQLVRTAQPGSLLALLNAAPGSLIDRIVHLLMPASVLSLLYMAGWSRFMRTSMLEVLRMDYVRTARAKGLLERFVIAKHAARNALIPLITIIMFQLPGIFGGAILTETIFSYPGMGRLYFQSLGGSDWPVVMVILFISAVLVVVATLIRDVLYTVVDPRIKFS